MAFTPSMRKLSETGLCSVHQASMSSVFFWASNCRGAQSARQACLTNLAIAKYPDTLRALTPLHGKVDASEAAHLSQRFCL